MNRPMENVLAPLQTVERKAFMINPSRAVSQLPVSSARALGRLTVTALAVTVVVACSPADPTDSVDPEVASPALSEFLSSAEQRLLEAGIETSEADWQMATDITPEHTAAAAAANEKLLGLAADLAAAAAEFDEAEAPAKEARKLNILKTGQTLPAPRDPAKQSELAELASKLESMYGSGKYCPDGESSCQELEDLETIIDQSRDPEALAEAWAGWRTTSRDMRPLYQRFAELANEGARDLGFSDVADLWRSGYDMEPEAFTAELDRLWEQVRPLYDQLHCHVRARLRDQYGDVVPADGPIPAHLLGNMWAQSWGNVYSLVAPPAADPGYDLSERLQATGQDPVSMVETGEGFFTSLGFEPLPETFWERSMLTKPEDRQAVCHASAWQIDYDDDVRIKMCIDVNAEDFSTIHHELGHNFYQLAYRHQDVLFRDSANDGFHEALGDTVALSVTPAYLENLGLIDEEPPASADLGLLMNMALEKVAFLPFGLLVDQWRWGVFSGDIRPDEYNQAWWELREKYQGVAAPVERSEEDFDAGAKYHVPANTPYTRYFLAHILQFQFQRALCDVAGYDGPLHRCSIYGHAEAGAKLREMMAMGSSEPWQDALEAVTGSRAMDASAILDYFAPLEAWLTEQNEGRTCGW